MEHLLAHGAACDADTFDGERCHFAALNDEIRARLATFHVVDADRLVVRQLFEEFLRKSAHHSSNKINVTCGGTGCR